MLKLKLKYLTRLCKQRDCSKRALHQAELLQMDFKQALHAIKLSNTSHLNALHMKEWFEIYGSFKEAQMFPNMSKTSHLHKDFQSYIFGQFIFTVFYSVGHSCSRDLCLDDEKVGLLFDKHFL